MRGDWREPEFWRWWWRTKAPPEAKVALVAFAALALLGAGLYSAERLSGSDGGGYALVTTVRKVVTVREHRPVAPEVVTVIRQGPRTTAQETKVGTRIVTAPSRVVRVPIVKSRVVTVDANTQTRVVTSRKTVDARTVTVANEHTVTVVTNHAETVVQPVTQTVSRVDTRTVVETRVVALATVTQPVPVPVTMTVTFP
jgi:hypothetical protein